MESGKELNDGGENRPQFSTPKKVLQEGDEGFKKKTPKLSERQKSSKLGIHLEKHQSGPEENSNSQNENEVKAKSTFAKAEKSILNAENDSKHTITKRNSPKGEETSTSPKSPSKKSKEHSKTHSQHNHKKTGTDHKFLKKVTTKILKPEKSFTHNSGTNNNNNNNYNNNYNNNNNNNDNQSTATQNHHHHHHRKKPKSTKSKGDTRRASSWQHNSSNNNNNNIDVSCSTEEGNVVDDIPQATSDRSLQRNNSETGKIYAQIKQETIILKDDGTMGFLPYIIDESNDIAREGVDYYSYLSELNSYQTEDHRPVGFLELLDADDNKNNNNNNNNNNNQNELRQSKLGEYIGYNNPREKKEDSETVIHGKIYESIKYESPQMKGDGSVGFLPFISNENLDIAQDGIDYYSYLSELNSYQTEDHRPVGFLELLESDHTDPNSQNKSKLGEYYLGFNPSFSVEGGKTIADGKVYKAIKDEVPVNKSDGTMGFISYISNDNLDIVKDSVDYYSFLAEYNSYQTEDHKPVGFLALLNENEKSSTTSSLNNNNNSNNGESSKAGRRTRKTRSKSTNPLKYKKKSSTSNTLRSPLRHSQKKEENIYEAIVSTQSPVIKEDGSMGFLPFLASEKNEIAPESVDYYSFLSDYNNFQTEDHRPVGFLALLDQNEVGNILPATRKRSNSEVGTTNFDRKVSPVESSLHSPPSSKWYKMRSPRKRKLSQKTTSFGPISPRSLYNTLQENSENNNNSASNNREDGDVDGFSLLFEENNFQTEDHKPVGFLALIEDPQDEDNDLDVEETSDQNQLSQRNYLKKILKIPSKNNAIAIQKESSSSKVPEITQQNIKALKLLGEVMPNPSSSPPINNFLHNSNNNNMTMSSNNNNINSTINNNNNNSSNIAYTASAPPIASLNATNSSFYTLSGTRKNLLQVKETDPASQTSSLPSLIRKKLNYKEKNAEICTLLIRHIEAAKSFHVHIDLPLNESSNELENSNSSNEGLLYPDNISEVIDNCFKKQLKKGISRQTMPVAADFGLQLQDDKKITDSKPMGIGLFQVVYDRWWDSMNFYGTPYFLGQYYADHSHIITEYLKILSQNTNTPYHALQYLQKIKKNPGTVGDEFNPIEFSDRVTKLTCGYNSISLITDLGEIYLSTPLSYYSVATGISHLVGDWSGRLTVDKLMGKRAHSVECGVYHFAAITDTKELVTWGVNYHSSSGTIKITGQLGHRLDRIRTPTVVTGFQGVPLKVACGAHHTVLVTSKGVYSFGANYFGQLGRSDVEQCIGSIWGIQDSFGCECVVSKVSCGYDHTLLATDNGMLFSWGSNHYGQLGIVNNVNFVSNPCIVELTGVIDVSCGAYHSVVMNDQREVFTFGSNFFGELGINTKTILSQWKPSLVNIDRYSTYEEIVSVSSGPHTSIAITNYGFVYMWGMLASKSFTKHQHYPRCFNHFRNTSHKLFITEMKSGLTHWSFIADNNLSNAITLLLSTCVQRNCFSPSPILDTILSIPSPERMFNLVQNRTLLTLHRQSGGLRPYVTLDSSFVSLSYRGSRTCKVKITNQTDIRIIVQLNACTYSNPAHSILITPSEIKLRKRASAEITLILVNSKPLFEPIYKLVNIFVKKDREEILQSSSSKLSFSRSFLIVRISPTSPSTILRPVSKLYSPESKDVDELHNLKLIKSLATYVPRVLLKQFANDPSPPDKPTISQFPAVILFLDISGFTLLNERLAQLGPEGPELVSKHINSYFASLIIAVDEHGGDVLKFAGDALMCMFSSSSSSSASPSTMNEEEGLDILTLRAVQCAFEIQTKLAKYDSNDGFSLTLHIGIGSGDLFSVMVGGIDGSWEYLVSGDPLVQLRTAVDNCKVGEVVVSAESWELIRSRCECQPQEFGYVVTSITSPIPINRSNKTPIAGWPHEGAEEALRCFIPLAVQASIDSQQLPGWADELRVATILFVKLNSDVPSEQTQFLQTIHEILCCMQQVIFKYDGMVRQFLSDDKGTVLIAAFGLPPLSHEDDAVRGVKAAREIHHTLLKLHMTSSIGVTTGQVFCGSVGCSMRQEYAMVGDIVNLSARLMVAAEKLEADILCDQRTAEAAHGLIVFDPLPPIFVKGKTQLIDIYRPVSESQPSSQSSYIQDRLADDKSIFGRETELKYIAKKCYRLVSGHHSGYHQVVIFKGEQGVGKSLLANYTLNLAQQLSLQVCVCRSDPVEKSTPLYPFRELIANMLGVSEQIRLKQRIDVSLLVHRLHAILDRHLQSTSSCRSLKFDDSESSPSSTPLHSTPSPSSPNNNNNNNNNNNSNNKDDTNIIITHSNDRLDGGNTNNDEKTNINSSNDDINNNNNENNNNSSSSSSSNNNNNNQTHFTINDKHDLEFEHNEILRSNNNRNNSDNSNDNNNNNKGDDDDDEAEKAKLRRTKAREEEWISLLSLLLPIDTEEDAIQSISALKMKFQVLAQFLRHLITTFCTRTRSVFVFEDIHYFDLVSLDLLEKIAITDEFPILLIVTMNVNLSQNNQTFDDKLKSITSSNFSRLVTLENLDPISANKMICHLLNIPRVTPSLEGLFIKLKHNPRLIEDMAIGLRDSGLLLIDPNGDCSLLGNVNDIALSAMKTSLQIQLDRLGADRQMILKVASVIGYVFDLMTITSIFPIAVKNKIYILRQLEALTNLGILLKVKQKGTYQFSSQTLLEVAFNRLTFSQRSKLHEAIANLYEANPTIVQSDSTRIKLIAYHLAQVVFIYNKNSPPDLLLRTITKLRLASEVAARASHFEETKEWFSYAMDLLKDLTDANDIKFQKISKELKLQVVGINLNAPIDSIKKMITDMNNNNNSNAGDDDDVEVEGSGYKKLRDPISLRKFTKFYGD